MDKILLVSIIMPALPLWTSCQAIIVPPEDEQVQITKTELKKEI